MEGGRAGVTVQAGRMTGVRNKVARQCCEMFVVTMRPRVAIIQRRDRCLIVDRALTASIGQLLAVLAGVGQIEAAMR